MKYDIQFTNQFKKDLELAKKQNKNLDKLFEVIDILANGGTLECLDCCNCPFLAHCVPVFLPHRPVSVSPDSGLRCGLFHHFLP